MPINDTSKLANKINALNDSQDVIKNNISPDDTESQLQSYLSEFVIVGGSITVNRLEWDTNSLVLDHPDPTWNTLNKSTTVINGGWVTVSGELARTQLDYIEF